MVDCSVEATNDYRSLCFSLPAFSVSSLHTLSHTHTRCRACGRSRSLVIRSDHPPTPFCHGVAGGFNYGRKAPTNGRDAIEQVERKKVEACTHTHTRARALPNHQTQITHVSGAGVGFFVAELEITIPDRGMGWMGERVKKSQTWPHTHTGRGG